MKLAIKSIIAVACLSSVVFSSCKKSNVEMGDYIGQPICASENFAVVTPFAVSSSNVNFTAGPYTATFTGEINENLEWTITITGQTTGAVKTFTQRSKVIDVVWYGNSDTDVFFGNETCDVTFTVSCRDPETYTLNVTNKSLFNAVLEKYIMVINFDGQGTIVAYQNAGVSVSNESATPSPQGGSYRRMAAAAGTTGWYIGGFDGTIDLSFLETANPDSVYINFYMKGNSNATTVSTVQFKDTDNAIYKKNIVGDFDEWRMISMPLSDFNVFDASKLNTITFSVGPLTENGECEVNYDFIIFSKGGPFIGPN